QVKGRFDFFADYHLRVGEVTFDSDRPHQAAIAERRFDDTEIGTAKVATLTEITPAAAADFERETELLPARFGLELKDGAIVGHDIFSSISNAGKVALLVDWKDAEAASAWTPKAIEGVERLRHRRIRIVRDYGRFDRREAPQFYADVKPAKS
ncbi:MAG: antibiotic biosynthesis monooxygenase, partial [Bradyrhizobium sp.]|nr:antibiotic biosynthesis monooxygenase [Bradyrhizobium sp.]